MRSDKSLTLHAVLSLTCGAFVYFLFRPGTLFLSFLPFSAPFGSCTFWGDAFVRYFLPDALWAYSLCFFLFRLHRPSVRKAVWLALLAAAFGCLWEGMQTLGVASGTGDALDCLAYGAGSITALGIYHLKRSFL